MAMCPLCTTRSGKRYCPAIAEPICAVCCGTKREIEIDCPSTCSYLKASREYELDKPLPDPQLAAKMQSYDARFVERINPVLEVLNRAILEEHLGSKLLVDNDVIEVLKSLQATMKTLSSGIYYDSSPEGSVRQSLFRRIKAVLDELMQPATGVVHSVLKVTEAVDILDFLTLLVLANSSVRPKSRRYLDWLAEQLGARPDAAQAGGIILP
jgi:hypothetical protein